MDITYIIGWGPNGMGIPLLAFSSEATARELLTGLGMIESIHGYDAIIIDGEAVEIYKVLDDDTEPMNRVRGALFKNGYYYGGCGECAGFSVVTVPEGTPVVRWDLD